MKTEHISNATKDLLAHAYQNTYDAFVKAYLAKGKTQGESRFNASCRMKQLISAHENEKDNPVIMYLRSFNDSHYSAEAKKLMDPKRNMDQIDPASLDVDMTDAIIDAINNFERVITAVSPNVLCVLRKTGAPDTNPQNMQKMRSDFSSWLDNTINDNEFAKLEKDPRYFEKLYRRYVMRQSHR